MKIWQGVVAFIVAVFGITALYPQSYMSFMSFQNDGSVTSRFIEIMGSVKSLIETIPYIKYILIGLLIIGFVGGVLPSLKKS